MFSLNDSPKDNNCQENSTVKLAKPNLQLFKILSSEFSVIPLKPRSKSPFERNWPQWCHKKRPWDPADFEDNRNAGICCGPASRVLVLDVDNPELFEDWLNEHRHVLPKTRIVKTGSGKYHYYFQYPLDGLEYGIKVLKHNGIEFGEIRGVGSMVVAPGSIHPETGQPYSWANMPDVPIVQPPQWLLNLYRNDHSPSDDGQIVTSGRQETSDVDALNVSDFIKDLITKPIPVGQRSEKMMSVLIALVRAGLSDAQITSIFEVYPIGEKSREKGASKEKWLRDQIQKAKSFVMGSLEVFTATDLENEDISEPDWVIENLLSPGVTLLAAPPKTGKTRLATNIAVGLALGTEVLNKIKVKRCGVLSLCLEDSKWRVKDRLSALLDGEPFPSNLHLATDWPMIENGGLERLDIWLEQHPKVKLVVIDVLARFRTAPKGNIYQEDYTAIARIQEVAVKHFVAVLVIHHTNKLQDSPDVFDKISGSTGLTAAADTVAVLERYNRTGAAAKLTIAGRDVEAQELAIEFDSCFGSWTLLGDADKYCTTSQRREIIDYLDSAREPKRTSEIAKALNRNHSTVRGLCTKMVKNGQLMQPDRGLYTTTKQHKQTEQGQQNKQSKQT